jgi:hypothetical protein
MLTLLRFLSGYSKDVVSNGVKYQLKSLTVNKHWGCVSTLTDMEWGVADVRPIIFRNLCPHSNVAADSEESVMSQTKWLIRKKEM